jgi:uridine kinase
MMTRPFIISITSSSGGGKTALTRRVAASVESGAGFYFDEFDSTNVYPADFCEWHSRGADVEEFDCPGMHRAVSDAIASNSVRCIVLDFPFGREHHRFKDLIDLTVFVDTPLDVAMARRITRDFIENATASAEERMCDLKQDLSHYVAKARHLFLAHHNQHRRKSDLVLDGWLELDVLRDQVLERMRSGQCA